MSAQGVRSFIFKRRILALVLILPALALFHAALVSALLSLGFSQQAEVITFSNPDVFEVRAKETRTSAVQESDALFKQQLLETSLSYWQGAISLRPTWPYYHLGALDVEVLLADREAVNQRLKTIIALAPNERGLDSPLLILSFVVWQWLERPEQDWLIKRLSIVNRQVLKDVFFYAKQANNQQVICARLAWNKVKKLCSR